MENVIGEGAAAGGSARVVVLEGDGRGTFEGFGGRVDRGAWERGRLDDGVVVGVGSGFGEGGETGDVEVGDFLLEVEFGSAEFDYLTVGGADCKRGAQEGEYQGRVEHREGLLGSCE